MNTFIRILVASFFLASGTSGLAATITNIGADPGCGDDDNIHRVFTLDGGSGYCAASGTNQLQGSQTEADTYLGTGWEYLGKDEAPDDKGGTPADTPLLSVSSWSGSGTITLASDIWDNYSQLAIGLKVGSGQLDPDWVIFVLASDTLVWDFDISAQALSHVNIYGVSAVPIPAALGLFGLGLAGLGLIRQRKQKHIA